MEMKRITTAIAIAAAIMAVALLTACTTASAVQEHEATSFKYVHDWAEPKVPSGAVRIVQEQKEMQAEQAEPVEQPIEEEAYYEEEYYSTPSYVGYRGDPNTLNNFNGVYEYEGRTESFYSGKAVYTDQLTVDDNGFYRTEEGYYAVATSDGDYSIGDTFEGSQGTCIVVDDGASPGVTDYYVSGWY